MDALEYHTNRLAQMKTILDIFEEVIEKAVLGTKGFPSDIRTDIANTIINQEMVLELEKLRETQLTGDEDLSDEQKESLDAQFIFLDNRFIALSMLQTALFSEDGMHAFRQEAKGLCQESPELKLVVKNLISRFEKIA